MQVPFTDGVFCFAHAQSESAGGAGAAASEAGVDVDARLADARIAALRTEFRLAARGECRCTHGYTHTHSILPPTCTQPASTHLSTHTCQVGLKLHDIKECSTYIQQCLGLIECLLGTTEQGFPEVSGPTLSKSGSGHSFRPLSVIYATSRWPKGRQGSHLTKQPFGHVQV